MTETIIRANSVDEVGKIFSSDLAEQVFEYNPQIHHNGRTILLSIDIDPGGGFESGFESTTLNCRLEHDPGFTLAIHHETFIDEVGKFFGMQDIVTGYEEFDKKVVVKSDNADRVKKVFNEKQVRKLFADLHGYNLHISHHHVEGRKDKAAYLEFFIEKGVTDAMKLTNIYSAFFTVLEAIDPLKLP